MNVAAFAQNVGDISFDPKTDDPNFKLCNPEWVLQTYMLKSIADETPLLVDREIRTKFTPRDEWKTENGIVTVRFVVNCNGQADRFRLTEMTFELEEKKFQESLRTHILEIAKSIQWPARRARQQTADYYHYFNLRIVDGQVKDIIQ
ncbi:MAG TPA: hypothetical protein VFE50_00585 [Cyclobacteriaceae bacterium]|nr:hypothetical protein [Cyclobacteriaceae bacterium]